MAKSAESKEERRMRKLRETYEQVCSDENIDTSLPMGDQIDKLMNAADELQSSICSSTDEIKEFYYEKFNDVYSKKSPINKSLFMQLVNLNTRRGYASEKALETLREKVDNELYFVNAKHQFLKNDFDESFEDFSDNVVKIPKGDVEFGENFETSKELDTILKEASKIKFKIDKVYKRQYKAIAQAVEYLTAGRISGNEWKILVDFKHYKGGYPNEESEGKMEAFTNKIEKVYHLYNDFGLTMFNSYLEGRNLKITEIK